MSMAKVTEIALMSKGFFLDPKPSVMNIRLRRALDKFTARLPCSRHLDI
jgi:hypothetical protein